MALSAGRLDQPTLAYHLAIVRGRYTLGEDPATCLEPATRAAGLYVEWVRRSGGSLQWSMEPELSNEFIGAAFLAGKSAEVFDALEQSRWKAAPPDWELAVLNLACRAFGGQPPESGRVPASMPKLPAPLPWLVPMLEAVIEGDVTGFGPAFVAFLTRSWGPSAEKGAKFALRSHWPLYTGKWSLLAAAACRRMGTIPDLPPMAEIYFPRELV